MDLRTPTIKLDFEDMRIKSVKYWALKINGKPKLGGGMILRLSEDACHMAFAVMFPWAKNLGIVAWVAILSKSVPLLSILRCSALRELSL